MTPFAYHRNSLASNPSADNQQRACTVSTSCLCVIAKLRKNWGLNSSREGILVSFLCSFIANGSFTTKQDGSTFWKFFHFFLIVCLHSSKISAWLCILEPELEVVIVDNCVFGDCTANESISKRKLTKNTDLTCISSSCRQKIKWQRLYFNQLYVRNQSTNYDRLHCCRLIGLRKSTILRTVITRH